MAEKMVFLGGGSPFMPLLIQAILENRDALSGSQVCLMDTDPTRLLQLKKLGEVMAEREGMDLAFAHTTDPREPAGWRDLRLAWLQSRRPGGSATGQRDTCETWHLR